MLEKSLERKLKESVTKLGGLALKFVSPGVDGVPDRLILFSQGRMAFVELKAPGQMMRPLQVQRKRQLEALGFPVHCIDRPEQIPIVLEEIQNAIHTS